MLNIKAYNPNTINIYINLSLSLPRVYQTIKIPGFIFYTLIKFVNIHCKNSFDVNSNIRLYNEVNIPSGRNKGDLDI